MASSFTFIIALTNSENDFQREQESVARLAAQKLGVNIEVQYAQGDAVKQSSQLMTRLRSGEPLHGVILAPVGPAMQSVAEEAVGAGIGWVILNRDADYLKALRQSNKAPTFIVSTDQEEVGRIQGRQMQALLKNGGSVLYVQGTLGSEATKGRTAGMKFTKPANIETVMLRGAWTEATGLNAVRNWLRGPLSNDVVLKAVVAQNDAMALGARTAIEELPMGRRERYQGVMYLGADGSSDGRQVVPKGLTGTIYIPPNAGIALELLAAAVRGGPTPVDRTYTMPKALPSLEALARL